MRLVKIPRNCRQPAFFFVRRALKTASSSNDAVATSDCLCGRGGRRWRSSLRVESFFCSHVDPDGCIREPPRRRKVFFTCPDVCTYCEQTRRVCYRSKHAVFVIVSHSVARGSLSLGLSGRDMEAECEEQPLDVRGTRTRQTCKKPVIRTVKRAVLF